MVSVATVAIAVVAAVAATVLVVMVLVAMALVVVLLVAALLVALPVAGPAVGVAVLPLPRSTISLSFPLWAEEPQNVRTAASQIDGWTRLLTRKDLGYAGTIGLKELSACDERIYEALFLHGPVLVTRSQKVWYSVSQVYITHNKKSNDSFSFSSVQ